MAEKRKYPRTPISLDVFFDLDGKRVVAKTRDLSVGGMYVFAEQKPGFGAQVELDVQFGGGFGTLSLSSVVRWVDAEGFGVQFGLLGARETRAIANALKTVKTSG